MDLKSTYNQIAEEWSQDHKSDTWWIDAADKFISFLKPGSTVLDMGCGDGHKSKYLADRGLKVTGADFSEKMIEICKREVLNAEFQVLDIFDLGKLGQKFDGVFVSAVLLHIPKAKVAGIFRDLADKTEGGGYMYVSVKEIRSGQKEEEALVENDYGYEYERLFCYFTLEEMRKYFEDNGFVVCWENVTLSGKTKWIRMIGQKLPPE